MIRAQSETDEFFICSDPIMFGTSWHRIGINFGAGGIELWIDGVRQGRSGMVWYRSLMFSCAEPHTLNLAGNDNPFVIGAVQVFSDAGSHLPLQTPYDSLEVDQLRLSAVRRDYENEIRP